MIKPLCIIFLSSLFFVSLSPSFLKASEEDDLNLSSQPLVSYTPSRSRVPYGGARKIFQENVLVSSAVSLGGSGLEKINNILKKSDDFIVFFMYRFDSSLLKTTLEHRHFLSENRPLILLFLDYHQIYPSEENKSSYKQFFDEVIKSIPTSTVKLGSKSFHSKVIIAKNKKKEAIVITGAANATIAADNVNSEDWVFIKSSTLASFYLQEFHTLLTTDFRIRGGLGLMEQSLKVYHEKRLAIEKSNLDVLQEITGSLLQTNKPRDVKEEPIKEEKVLQSVKYSQSTLLDVGLSTGFTQEKGTQKCLHIIEDALKNDFPKTKFLILFENFLSVKADGPLKECLEFLSNSVPKLIVLDDNEHTQAAKETLKGKNNTILLFKPYTGGKFHHKLIIRYPAQGGPVVYTGSFHLSNSAIEKNSETLISCRSQKLASELIGSILTQSGLAERPEVWKFLEKNLFSDPRYNISSNNPILEAAQLAYSKTQQRIEGYWFRLEAVQESMKEMIGDPDQQSNIDNLFTNYKEQFEQGDIEMKQGAIQELKNTLFQKEPYCSAWMGSIQQKIITIIEKEGASFDLTNIQNLEEKFIEECLNSLNEAFNQLKITVLEKKSKEKVNSLIDFYRALHNLHSYEDDFSSLADLFDCLTEILRDKLKRASY